MTNNYILNIFSHTQINVCHFTIKMQSTAQFKKNKNNNKQKHQKCFLTKTCTIYFN